MDTSKHFFQLHGVNAAEKVVLRKKLRRKEMVAFFKALAPTVIGIEACGASHHWARILRSFGHEVKLIAPQLVKPYVKRGKNDTADAEALCEAMSRPTMRFVPVKTAEQQAALMMVALRDRLIRNRTQLSNAIRGYAAEFGFTAARGMAHIDPLLDRIQADENVPVLARELFAAQACKFARNNDPLRGDFRVQLRPPSYTVSVSLPFSLEGISGDDSCGHDWPNPTGLFRTAMADQEDRADSFGIARHGAQGDPRS